MVSKGDKTAADAARLDIPLDAALDLDRDCLTLRLKSEWVVGATTYPPDAFLVLGPAPSLPRDRDFHVLFDPEPPRDLTPAPAPASA